MGNKVNSTKKRVLSMLLLGTLAMSALGASESAFAVTKEQAEANLTTGIYNMMAEEEYTLEGGGSVTGKELFNKESNGSDGTTYDVNEDQFKDLTKRDQQRFTTDLVRHANDQVGENGVTTSTVTGLLQRLQTKEGMGSKLLMEILRNTRPDYASANRIYQPFSGPLGIFLGLGSILILAFLGVVMVSDIAFITLPPFQAVMGGVDGVRSGENKTMGRFLISHEAVSAAQEAQNSDNSSNGGYKHAIGIYLKRRIMALILLGGALLYLVHGQIWILVGYLLDLVSGFLGF